MNIKEYISSGIIELYVMDSLPEKEREEVQKNALLYPEIVREIESIELALEKYVSAFGEQPRSELKNRILENIETSEIKNINPSSYRFYKYAAAASIVLFIVSSVVNYVFWNKWKSARNEISLLTSQQEQYAQQFNLVKNSYDKSLVDIHILQDTSYKHIVMKGLSLSPHSIVSVYWNPVTSGSYIQLTNIPTPPAGKQYQLWAIVAGKPVDAGVIEFGDNLLSLQKMKNIAGAQAFAITLEPEGGSVSPTLDQMFVLGNV